MNYSSKQIKRSIRDFENILSDIEDANSQTYSSLIRRLIEFINRNEIIKKIIEPLINIDLNFDNILKRHPNGWGDLHLPQNINEHIAFVLQLFIKTDKGNFNITNFFLSYFKLNNYDDCIYTFNENIVRPAFREILIKLNDFIEDEVEDSEELNLTNIQIFHIGEITATNSNVTIGNSNTVNSNLQIDTFKEDFIKALLNNGLAIDVIDSIRPTIDEMHTELSKNHIDKPFFNKLLSKFKDVGGKLIINTLVTIVTKPEIISIIQDFIKNTF